MRRGLLIVEGDPDVAASLVVNLSAYGANVRVCDSVKTALQELECHRWDLVVLDLDLPGGGGLPPLRCSLGNVRKWVDPTPIPPHTHGI